MQKAEVIFFLSSEEVAQRNELNVFKDDVKNSKGIRAKGFFASALKMKQPQGVSNQTKSKEVKQK